METVSQECQICANHFTAKERSRMNCPRCDFECCTACFKTQCMQGTDPICMNPECRTVFNEEFLYKHLTPSFMKNQWRKKQGENLLEREKSLLQSTMPYVEAEVTRREVETHLNDLKETKKKLRAQLRNCAREISEQNLLLSNLRTLDDETIGSAEVIKNGSKNYLKKCPMNNCRGFLNSQYKCDLCKVNVCSKCFEEKLDGHVCNEDTLATAELLRKDTKACPNCSEMIHKIEGCNQMYCVSCHTGFDWKTGRIVTGVIHNPHYFEWMRQQGVDGRTVGDIPCGGAPSINHLTNKVALLFNTNARDLSDYSRMRRHRYQTPRFNYLKQKIGEKPLEAINWCTHVLQFATHLRQLEIPVHQPENNFGSNLKTRIKYLLNEIDDDTLKKNALQKHMSNMKKRHISDIYTTLATVIEDKLRQFAQPENDSANSLEVLVNETVSIIKYSNECFNKLANTYKQTYPEINHPYLAIPSGQEYFNQSLLDTDRRIQILTNGNKHSVKSRKIN